MPERRRFRRIQRRYNVEFRWDGKNCAGFTHNLSAMGLFICSVTLPKPGTALGLRMKVPGRKNILLDVRVVRSYRSPANLVRFVPSGFCVSLRYAPEEYFEILASLLRVAA